MFDFDLDPFVLKGTWVEFDRIKGRTRRCGSVTSDHHRLAPGWVDGKAKSRRNRDEAPGQSADQRSATSRSLPASPGSCGSQARSMPTVGEESTLNRNMPRNQVAKPGVAFGSPPRRCGREQNASRTAVVASKSAKSAPRTMWRAGANSACRERTHAAAM